jgi:hypothetical protein
VCVVGVEVGQQDDVGACGVSGRSLAPDSTEVAHPRGQNRVEQKSRAAVLPSDSAVPPPGNRAGHDVVLPSTPANPISAFADATFTSYIIAALGHGRHQHHGQVPLSAAPILRTVHTWNTARDAQAANRHFVVCHATADANSADRVTACVTDESMW